MAAALGISAERLYMPRQVHGRDVIVIEASHAPSQVATLAADAGVTREPGVACGVRSADCVPILLADPASGRVAAVHAGWRGVAANIAGACVEKMTLLGSRASELVAAFGPHISVAAFEIGEDVAGELERTAGGSGSILREAGRRPHADLARIVRAQLALAGLEPGRIEQVEGCTFSDPLSFFSHRRDGSPGGRQLSAIVSRC
jgi:YfiH family protein